MNLKVHHQTHLDAYVSIPELEGIIQALRQKEERANAVRDKLIIKAEDHEFNATLSCGDFSITFHLAEPTNYQCIIQGGKEVFLPSL